MTTAAALLVVVVIGRANCSTFFVRLASLCDIHHSIDIDIHWLLFMICWSTAALLVCMSFLLSQSVQVPMKDESGPLQSDYGIEGLW